MHGGFGGAFDVTGLGGGAVAAPPDRLDALLDDMKSRGADIVLGSDADWDELRIRRSLPRFGVDFGDKNYPQEASLEKIAVSFQKGCYLGQEVVCRLEMRGHVVKKIVPVRLDGDIPPRRGRRSDRWRARFWARSPARPAATTDGALALAMVRLDFTEPGTKLDVGGREATVPRRPMSSARKSSTSRPGVVDDALELIGRTPLVRLASALAAGRSDGLRQARVAEPGGSIKDRPALAMILAAEKAGAIRPGATIIEATSGNTGISLAMIAAVRGYRCVLVMPEDMSLERRYVLRAYGAEIVLTPAGDGMAGAVDRARELAESTPNAFMPRQFENAENPESHERTTALEILEQTDGKLDAFVAGVGTGGTLTGVGRVLREELGETSRSIVAVEPAASAVLSGQPAGMHGIQGLGAGFVPSDSRSLACSPRWSRSPTSPPSAWRGVSRAKRAFWWAPARAPTCTPRARSPRASRAGWWLPCCATRESATFSDSRIAPRGPRRRYRLARTRADVGRSPIRGKAWWLGRPEIFTTAPSGTARSTPRKPKSVRSGHHREEHLERREGRRSGPTMRGVMTMASRTWTSRITAMTATRWSAPASRGAPSPPPAEPDAEADVGNERQHAGDDADRHRQAQAASMRPVA